MVDEESEDSSRAQDRWNRVGFWVLGTVVAGAIPLCAVPGVLLFVLHEVPTWTATCRRGDFFIVSTVIVIAASIELLSALWRHDVERGPRRIMTALLTGGIFLLVGMIGTYLLVLSGVEQGQPAAGKHAEHIVQGIVNWTSPVALVIAAVYGAFSAYLSGDE